MHKYAYSRPVTCGGGRLRAKPRKQVPPFARSLGAATCAGLPPDMRPLGGGVTAAAAAMAPAAPMAVGARSHLISGVRSPGVRSFARSLESLSPERGASSPQLLQPAAARQQPLLMVANGS